MKERIRLWAARCLLGAGLLVMVATSQPRWSRTESANFTFNSGPASSVEELTIQFTLTDKLAEAVFTDKAGGDLSVNIQANQSVPEAEAIIGDPALLEPPIEGNDEDLLLFGHAHRQKFTEENQSATEAQLIALNPRVACTEPASCKGEIPIRLGPTSTASVTYTIAVEITITEKGEDNAPPGQLIVAVETNTP